MASPADRQSDANRAVEKIAEELFGLIRAPWSWVTTNEAAKERWRGYVRTLIRRGTIEPGKGLLPNVERPMKGQTTIEEMTDDDGP